MVVVFVHLASTRRFQHLASPGPCLPGLGHLQHLLTRSHGAQQSSYHIHTMVIVRANHRREGRGDPVNTLWNLYKKHSRFISHVLHVY